MSGLPDFRDAWYGNPLFEPREYDRVQDSTEAAARRGRNTKGVQQDEVQCPNCDKQFGNLPLHLATCDGGDA
jgi:hypothetical protein